MAINVKKYIITVTCEICGCKIIVEDDSLNDFTVAIKAAYDNNWQCPSGHEQPSVAALKKRREQD